MSFLDVSKIKLSFVNCFTHTDAWYERAVFFSVVQVSLFLFCLLPYGFIAILFLLPYLAVIEKASFIAYSSKQKLKVRDFILSARRYGRCFCIFIAKLLMSPFIYPFLSMTFSSFILADCKELDFKGVLMLSNELSKGKRFRIFSYLMFLFALLVSLVCFSFGLLEIVQIFCSITTKTKLCTLLCSMLLSLALVIFPLWRKHIEYLYLSQKTETIRGN